MRKHAALFIALIVTSLGAHAAQLNTPLSIDAVPAAARETAGNTYPVSSSYAFFTAQLPANTLTLSPTETYTPTKGIGWDNALAPADAFSLPQFGGIRTAALCDGVAGPDITLRLDLAPRRWTVIAYLDDGYENAHTVTIEANGRAIAHNPRTFGLDAEPPAPPINRYRVAEFTVQAKADAPTELRFRQPGPGGVRILAIQLIPMDWPETDTTRWIREQLDFAGRHDFRAPLDILSSELSRRGRANPDQAAPCAYWKAQVDILAEAEHWHAKGGFDEVSASTKSSMFARYKIAVSLLDPLVEHADGDVFPLRDRARWLRARLLFWLWAEQECDGDQYAAMNDLAALRAKYPDDKLIAMYAGEKIPDDQNPFIVKPQPGAPAWSSTQLEALERLREIARYWIDQRQIPNGEFGGKTDDDVELLRWWPVLMLTGDTHVRDGFGKLANCIWFSPRVYQGYSKVARDVEHSSEFVSDTIPMMALLTRDPEWIARLGWSHKYMRDLWTGHNAQGDLQFKSAWIGALDILTEAPRNRDLAMNTRAAKAVRYHAWLTGDADATRLLHDWSLTWAKAAARTDKNKPRGIFPASLRFPDGATNGDEPTWYRANMFWDYFDWDGNGLLYDQLLSSWLATRDARLLEPMSDTLAFLSTTKPSANTPVTAVPVPVEGLKPGTKIQPPANVTDSDEGTPAWAAARMLESPEFWDVVTQWRLETGDKRYDTFLIKNGPPYLRYRLTGNATDIVTTLEENLLSIIRYNRPLLTSEVLFTDRVYVANRSTNFDATSTLTAMLTGCHTAQGLSPYYYVAWENAPDSFTALVKETGTDRLAADIYLHQRDAATVTARLMRLEQGIYKVTITADGKTLTERTETITAPDQRVALQLPGAALVTLKITRTGSLGGTGVPPVGSGDMGVPPMQSPHQIALAAANVIVRDALFEFKNEPWEAPDNIQVLNLPADGTPARAEITLTAADIIRFGIAGASRVKITIDGKDVHERTFSQPAVPVEYAYDLFRWPAEFNAALTAGKHQIAIAQTSPNATAAAFFIQAINAHGGPDTRVTFSEWKPTSQRAPVRDLAINPKAAFKKHSLVEWHYANGATHLALLEAADATHNAALRDHVNRYTTFTLENLPWQREQYTKTHAWRAANYRLFRGCLLDDTTAPALPFMELVRRGELPAAAPLMDELLTFLLTKHPRLADGTLCRDEPEPQTVWADDLFMSTTFLARAAVWKNDPRLYDEMVKQIQGFHSHLINPTTNLYYHGYYAARKTPAAFQWARANGWIAWALSENLRCLPKTHPGYEKILALHKQHLATLLRYQEKSGFWHQLLDHPESFEETSATAMFFIAIMRGMKEGWLDRATYEEPARRAWAALQTRIDAKGVITGICGGTGIGDSVEYYNKRPQPNHDPRGMGAYITAAILAAEL